MRRMIGIFSLVIGAFGIVGCEGRDLSTSMPSAPSSITAVPAATCDGSDLVVSGVAERGDHATATIRNTGGCGYYVGLAVFKAIYGDRPLTPENLELLSDHSVRLIAGASIELSGALPACGPFVVQAYHSLNVAGTPRSDQGPGTHPNFPAGTTLGASTNGVARKYTGCF